MKKTLLLFAIGTVVGWGQITYTVSKTTVLSGSAEVITVQQPATGAKIVGFVGVYIDSTATCAITIERNGTAATSTTLIPAKVNPDQTAPVATGWSASNVGTGTVITVATVNGFFYQDLSKVYLYGNGTSKNLTVRTGSCSATVDIVITFTEVGN